MINSIILLAASILPGQVTPEADLYAEGFVLQEVKEDGTKIFGKPVTYMACDSGSCGTRQSMPSSNNRPFPRLQKLLPANKEMDAKKDPNEPPKPTVEINNNNTPVAVDCKTDCCKELELKIQRINGEIDSMKRENELTKTYIEAIEKKTGEVTLKVQNMQVSIQNLASNDVQLDKNFDSLNKRVTYIEENLKDLSGKMRFKLQFDPVSGTVKPIPLN